MKSVFEEATHAELISRINTLNENNKPEWGKMNVYQMLKHVGNGRKWYRVR